MDHLNELYQKLQEAKKDLEHHRRDGNRVKVTEDHREISSTSLAISEAIREEKRKEKYLRKAFKHLRKALEMDKEINEKEGVAKDYSLLGALELERGDDQKGVRYLKKAVKLCEARDLKIHLGFSLMKLGEAYLAKERLRKASEILERATKRFSDMRVGTMEVQALTDLAFVYREMGEKEKTEEFLQRAIEWMETHETSVRGRTALMIGNLCASMDFSNKAINYEKMALKDFKRRGMKKDMFLTYRLLAREYMKIDENEKAIEYQRKASDLLEG